MSDVRKDSRSGWRGSLFGGSMQTAIGVLVLLFTIGVFGFVIRDAIVSSSKDKTSAKRIIATRWNERTLVFPIEGVDKSNRHVVFDVVVLTKDYGWVRGSTTELEKGERRLSPDEIQNEVLAPQLRKGLGTARALIAVGLASQEGDVSREEQRGGLRAIRTAELVRGAVGSSIPMWTLNLGRSSSRSAGSIMAPTFPKPSPMQCRTRKTCRARPVTRHLHSRSSRSEQ